VRDAPPRTPKARLRQGPRPVRSGRRPPADRRLRPHLRLRASLPHLRPRQGPRAHRDERVLVPRARRRPPEPPRDLRRAAHPRVRPRPRAAGRAARHAAGGGGRPWLPHRPGVCRLPQVGCGVRADVGARPRRIGAAARADLHAVHQGASRGEGREHRLRDVRVGARPGPGRGGPGGVPGAVPPRCRACGGAGSAAGRHEVRVRHRRRWPARARGRAADAGFGALLARRRSPARRPAAVVRQAARARLAGRPGVRLGPRVPAAAVAARGGDGHAPPVRRGVPPHHRAFAGRLAS